MLIDEITIRVSAGKGGKGAVAFDKNKMAIGPTGADGGKGGDVYFEGASDISLLNQFRYKKELVAEDGAAGRGQFRDGPDGKDVTIKVPVGTVLHNLTTETDTEITKIGERVRIAEGGKGGKGNFKFRSPKDTSPTRFQPGLPGESFEFQLELKLLADVGLVGLPSAGKSSLLNELTNAKSKVGNYPFTTLEPHLGAYYELILADIPGLIEGASVGKGLGDKFLRHIERTKTLFHLVSAESDDVVRDYNVIRYELGSYNPLLLKKEEYILLTKSDVASEEDLGNMQKLLSKLNPKIIPISIHDHESIKEIETVLRKLIKEKSK